MSLRDEQVTSLLGGYKAAIRNQDVSEEGKEEAEKKLRDLERSGRLDNSALEKSQDLVARTHRISPSLLHCLNGLGHVSEASVSDKAQEHNHANETTGSLH